MSRLIDADALIKNYIVDEAKDDSEVISRADINNAPTVDAEPIRHGEWDYLYESSDINRCTLCGFLVQDKISNVREMFNYCPNCGAKMLVERKE